MDGLAFFATEDVKDGLRKVRDNLGKMDEVSNTFLVNCWKELAVQILTSPEEADEKCSYFIGSDGADALKFGMHRIGTNTAPQDIENTLILFYRVALELDLTADGRLQGLARNFVSSLESGQLGISDNAKNQIQYERNKLPISIVRGFYKNPRFSGLPKQIEEISGKIDKWNEEISSREDRISLLKKNADRVISNYNFVSLKNGFSDMLAKKEAELITLRKLVFWFGILMICPVLFDIIYIISHRGDKFDIYLTSILAALSISLSMFLIYFFRISLKNYDICKLQITEIDLKITLCQFVQDYADYAEDIKKKSEGTLEKFETVVFSAISTGDSQNLSFVDGLEQIVNLVKAAK